MEKYAHCYLSENREKKEETAKVRSKILLF